ncbi:DUF1811 family protein [Geobacillus stearothermophilus]|uniref:DUF1811 family protein n=1 Tax=Geobacillus stearothermophilus TaxID=1422 RepID=UPI001F3954C3|nr:DUF1811 family protein [Geobacillus stearothermophilus]
MAVGCRYLNDGRKQRGWQAFFLPTVETQGKTVSVEDKLLTIPDFPPGEIYEIEGAPGEYFKVRYLKGVFAWGWRLKGNGEEEALPISLLRKPNLPSS